MKIPPDHRSHQDVNLLDLSLEERRHRSEGTSGDESLIKQQAEAAVLLSGSSQARGSCATSSVSDVSNGKVTVDEVDHELLAYEVIPPVDLSDMSTASMAMVQAIDDGYEVPIALNVP